MKLMPTAGSERTIHVISLLRTARRREWLTPLESSSAGAALAGEWQLARPIVRMVGFFIGLILVSTFFSFLALLEIPTKGVITAVGGVAVAELLILRKRFWRSGIEEILWIGGLFAIVFDLPGPPKNERLILFAFASLVAAVRLLQPWFAALFVLFLAWYSVTEFERQLVGPAVVYAFGALALLLLVRRWRMPLVEGMLSIVAVAALPAAFLLLRFTTELDYDVALLAGGVSVSVFLLYGLLMRHRAPLWGGILTAALVLFDLASRVQLAAEWKWLMSGSALVLAAQLIDRALRERKSGLTSRREPAIELYSLTETAVAHSAAVASRPEGAPGPADHQTGGGQFGGGGASGEY